ncbi:MAG: DUF3096 domain-containing protein [Gammaproteobacteria bacterium]|nr:DUF3096 domain-containing protein [Gammaproteobacteria bacterium]
MHGIFFGHPLVVPLVSLLAGIAILMVPRLLNYIVAGYLIVLGLVGLLDYLRPTM